MTRSIPEIQALLVPRAVRLICAGPPFDRRVFLLGQRRILLFFFSFSLSSLFWRGPTHFSAQRLIWIHIDAAGDYCDSSANCFRIGPCVPAGLQFVNPSIHPPTRPPILPSPLHIGPRLPNNYNLHLPAKSALLQVACLGPSPQSDHNEGKIPNDYASALTERHPGTDTCVPRKELE